MTDDFDAVMGKDTIKCMLPLDEEGDVPEDEVVRYDGVRYQVVEVYNHATVTKSHYINSVNGYETHVIDLGQGDTRDVVPEYVTERLARILRDDFGIDVDDRDIGVVNVTDDDVVLVW